MQRRTAGIPAYRIVATLVAFLVVIFSILVSRAFYGNETTLERAQDDLTHDDKIAVTDIADSRKDSDKDGLEDWQELLHGTDSQIADTDGDGAGDADEIRAGDDPLDPVRPGTPTTGQSSIPTTEIDTATDQVAKELFASFAYQVQQNKQLSEADQERIVEQAIDDARTELVHPQYTRADVRVVEASNTSRATYIASITEIVANMTSDETNENAAMMMLAQGNTEAAKAQLALAVVVYKSFGNDIHSVPCPSDAVNVHLAMANSLLQYASILESVAVYDADPLRAALGANSVQAGQAQIEVAFRAFGTYAQTHQTS